MMTVEMFFDYSCPYAYLASTRIEALCGRNNAHLVWRPMLLGAILNELGTSTYPLLATATERDVRKALHNREDVARFAELWGVPLNWPEAHPIRTVTALRATLVLPAEERAVAIHALYRAYWVDGRDVSDAHVVAAVLTEVGLPGRQIVDSIGAEVKDALRHNTEQALERGVFGAPTFFVGGEMFWGQDRMWMVEQALDGTFEFPGEGRFKSDGPAPDVEFWFDFSSPFGYLASTRVEALCRRYGATLHLRPLFLGGLFRKLEGPMVPLATFPPAKQRYYAADLERWARHWGVDYQFPTGFPMNTIKALRIALGLGDGMAPFVHRVFRAFWVEDLNINDDDVLAQLLKEVGQAPERVAVASDPLFKQRLIEATDEAYERGIFGVPTFMVGGNLVWGQDRLFMVERMLQGWDPRARPGA